MVLLKLLMDKIRCPECRIPRWVSLIGRWTPDGIFQHRLSRHNPPPTLVIEVDEYRAIFQSLQEALGFNIDRIITEAERKSVKAFIRSILEKYPRVILDNFLVRRQMSKILMALNYIAGFGRTEICSLKPSTHVLYHCSDLYYLPLGIGDGQGFFEVLFGGTTVANGMELSEGEYVIACVRSEQASEIENRLEYVPRKPVPGSVRHERCPRCGVPLKAADFEWDWDKGIITNMVNGLREMVATTSGVEAVCRELTDELGRGIPALLTEAERKFTAERVEEYGLRLTLSGRSDLEEDNEENLRILLADFPFRGMGNPIDLSLQEGVLRLKVDNPFNENLICGKVLGFYEALEERKGLLEWEVPEDEWSVSIKISPA